MKNLETTTKFLNKLLLEIHNNDKLHSKRIASNIEYIRHSHPDEFVEIMDLIFRYYSGFNLSVEQISKDYLKMISDYRKDGLFFYKYGKYRCENQQMAFDNVYSKPEIMSYYMNALLISQVLWRHHFDIYIYFQSQLIKLFDKSLRLKILDVGPGHGFFSYLVKKNFECYEKMDLVDISETSLLMTKKIIGFDSDKINYFNKDIFLFDEQSKYDFIVLGEVIEHLDQPKEILEKLTSLLSDDGIFWITTPTNSPAIDHVYLFRNRKEVLDLVESAGLEIINSGSFIAEDVDEVTADEKKITNLVGLFCRKKNNLS
jgi:2-polyprenyl-3-methyl-5-hydroxy-6-metoxy-1,4-benzoquinol methylase